mgnify:CR=1 FL=1
MKISKSEEYLNLVAGNIRREKEYYLALKQEMYEHFLSLFGIPQNSITPNQLMDMLDYGFPKAILLREVLYLRATSANTMQEVANQMNISTYQLNRLFNARVVKTAYDLNYSNIKNSHYAGFYSMLDNIRGGIEEQ